MKITFLGTSSGTPTKNRNVSAIAIQKDSSKSWNLVDCGEGTQHQLLHTKLSLTALNAIFITHVHGDHCFGLPGLLASASLLGRKDPLVMVAPAAIKQWLEATTSLSQTTLNFEIDFIAVESLDEVLQQSEFDIEPIELSHRVASYAYSFTENNLPQSLDIEKLRADGIPPSEVWGKLQNGEDVVLDSGETLRAKNYLLPAELPRKIIISGDNDQASLLAESAKTANVLVHESTYTQEISDKVGAGPQHSSAKSVAEFAEQAKLPNLVLTHFSARYQKDEVGASSINEVEDEAARYYSGTLFLANDFDEFRLDKKGVLRLEANSEH